MLWSLLPLSCLSQAWLSQWPHAPALQPSSSAELHPYWGGCINLKCFELLSYFHISVQSICPILNKMEHCRGWALLLWASAPGSRELQGRVIPSHPHQVYTEIHLKVQVPSQNVIMFTSVNETHRFCLSFQVVWFLLAQCSITILCCRRDKALALFSATAIYIL